MKGGGGGGKKLCEKQEKRRQEVGFLRRKELQVTEKIL